MKVVPVHRCLSWKEWLACGVPALIAWPAVSAGLAATLGVVAGGAAVAAIRRRRRSPAFTARYFQLSPDVLEILELQAEAMADLATCRERRDLGVLAGLPARLGELARRAFDFGVALKRLDSLPAEKDLNREIRALDRKIAKGSDETQKTHWVEARAHLTRELATIRRARDQRRDLESRLFALTRFFRATRTEMRSLSARVVAHDPHAGQPGAPDPMLTGDVQDILGAVADLEQTLQAPGSGPLLLEP